MSVEKKLEKLAPCENRKKVGELVSLHYCLNIQYITKRQIFPKM